MAMPSHPLLPHIWRMYEHTHARYTCAFVCIHAYLCMHIHTDLGIHRYAHTRNLGRFHAQRVWRHLGPYDSLQWELSCVLWDIQQHPRPLPPAGANSSPSPSSDNQKCPPDIASHLLGNRISPAWLRTWYVHIHFFPQEIFMHDRNACIVKINENFIWFLSLKSQLENNKDTAGLKITLSSHFLQTTSQPDHHSQSTCHCDQIFTILKPLFDLCFDKTNSPQYKREYCSTSYHQISFQLCLDFSQVRMTVWWLCLSVCHFICVLRL